MSQRRRGPEGELFFFFLKKEPTVLSELVEFGPCIEDETVKACALIGPAHDGKGECPSVGQGLFLLGLGAATCQWTFIVKR